MPQFRQTSTTIAAPETALSFRPIPLGDMPRLRQYLSREQGRTTDFSFLGVAMWIDYFKYQYCIFRDTLFIKGVLEDDRRVEAFSMPVGALPLSLSVPYILGYCRARGLAPRFSAVPEYALPGFMQFSPKEITELPDWSDYLYDADKLATLSGKKMAKKRNHLNRFLALYQGRWQLTPLTPRNAVRALRFMGVADLEGDNAPEAAAERDLTRRILENYDRLSPYLHGALLEVDGHVCAFTVADIKGDTLFIHIEKATRSVEAAYEAINALFARIMTERHPEIRYINREDDAGDEGLRHAKQSYHPLALLKKFNLRL